MWKQIVSMVLMIVLVIVLLVGPVKFLQTSKAEILKLPLILFGTPDTDDQYIRLFNVTKGLGKTVFIDWAIQLSDQVEVSILYNDSVKSTVIYDSKTPPLQQPSVSQREGYNSLWYEFSNFSRYTVTLSVRKKPAKGDSASVSGFSENKSKAVDLDMDFNQPTRDDFIELAHLIDDVAKGTRGPKQDMGMYLIGQDYIITGFNNAPLRETCAKNEEFSMPPECRGIRCICLCKKATGKMCGDAGRICYGYPDVVLFMGTEKELNMGADIPKAIWDGPKAQYLVLYGTCTYMRLLPPWPKTDVWGRRTLWVEKLSDPQTIIRIAS